MRLKFLWLAMGGFMSANVGRAQTYSESALLFSKINPGGSARIQGMGGAQTALGADISSAHSNPAGLGMYNRSEASVSIGIQHTNMNSNYFDNSKSAGKTNFNLPNLGVAFCSRQRNDKGFIGGTFAVTYNRVNSFSQQIQYEGDNRYNSAIDRYIAQAQENEYDSEALKKGKGYNTYAGLAWRNYLIRDSTEAKLPPGKSNSASAKVHYFSPLGIDPKDEKDIRHTLQQEDVLRSGKQSQMNFSYGGNFNDRFYVGGGVGIAFLSYSGNNNFTESNFRFERNVKYKPVNYYTLKETLILEGIGINATISLIARPLDALQLGFSYTTPTSYSVTETYYASMNSEWNEEDKSGNYTGVKLRGGSNTDELQSTYTLKTPSRLNGGVTVFIKKKGFITGDIQMTDYSGARFNALSTNDFSKDNAIIKNSLKRVFNFRLGGECRIGSYRVRAGYGIMPDPFKEKSFDINQAISSYSLGAGYRTPKISIDVAAILTGNNFVYRPYRLEDPNNPHLDAPNSPHVDSKRQNVSVVITASFPLNRQ